MISSAGSPSTVSTTRPRICALRYGFASSTTESATRGSRAMLRAFRERPCVKNAMRPSSRIAQTGIECGAPSGSSVARWTKLRPSVKSDATFASSGMRSPR